MAELLPTSENPPEPDLSNRQIGNYHVGRRLGRGGMADVYLAEQTSLKRQIALKVLHNHLAGDTSFVRRFHNEALSGGNSASPALMAQSPRHAWAIMDTPMTATMEIADPYYRDGDKVVRAKVVELLDNSPFIRKADTLAELAERMAVDVETFLATVARYNKACEARLAAEPEFGKPLKSSKAFDTPPYYAVQIFPLARKNFGGAKTDLQCRVLDKHFEPIAGLYAAGEVAGMAGGHINGRAGLEGTMLGPSIFSGRVAGGWAAHASGHGRGFVGMPNRS